MGIGSFDEVGLVPVAYVHVASDGTASSNSGVTVTRLGVGTYKLVLPPDKSIPDTECFPVIQPWGAVVASAFTPSGAPTAREYLVQFQDTSGVSTDVAFTAIIMRSILPPTL
jgi:hypothetical protein